MVENHHPWPRLTGALVLLLLSIGFFWKLTSTDEYLWMDSPDLTNQVLPWWEHQAREWHAGRFPAWEPHQWGGQPLIGQTQPGAAYPLNWLLFLTPLKDGKLRQGYLDGYYVLLRYIAALNCFLLCWWLGRSWWASIVAGCIFGFGGYVGNVDWPQMVNGAIWSPLVFLFILRGGAYFAALAGFFLGLSWLSGHHQAPVFLTYASGGLWLWILWRRRQAAVIPALVFGVFFAATAALQLLPALEYGQIARRWVGAPEPVSWKDRVPYQVHGDYSMRPWMLLGFFLPNLSDLYKGFVGPTALTLATAGVVLGRGVRIWAWVGGFGLLVALGYSTPVHGWMYAWAPMVEKARSPVAAVYLANLAIAVLASAGVDALRAAAAPLWRRLIHVLVATGALITGVFLTAGVFKGRELIADDRPMLMAACMFMGAVTIQMARRRQWPFAGLLASLLGLILVENASSSSFYWTSRAAIRNDGFIQKTWEHDDIAEFLRREPQPVRVVVDDKAIPYNFGDFHGIDTWGGYLASLTANIVRLDANHEQMQKSLGITHWIGTAPQNDQQTEAFTGKSGVKVFRASGSFPRARVVRTIFPVRDALEATTLMVSPLMDFTKAVFVFGPAPAVKLPPPDCGPDRVRVLRDVGGLVEMDADLGCEGAVIVGDTWAPGWRAYVDGRETPVFEANGLVRGMIVPRGKHRLEMRYRPSSLTAGAWLTGLGFAGMLGWSLWRARVRVSGHGGTQDEADLGERG